MAHITVPASRRAAWSGDSRPPLREEIALVSRIDFQLVPQPVDIHLEHMMLADALFPPDAR